MFDRSNYTFIFPLLNAPGTTFSHKIQALPFTLQIVLAETITGVQPTLESSDDRLVVRELCCFFRVLSASVQNLAFDLNGLFGIFPCGRGLARSGIRRAGMGRAGARTGRVSTRDGLGPAGFRLARDAATARISAA
jgi:hypothetical protein